MLIATSQLIFYPPFFTNRFPARPWGHSQLNVSVTVLATQRVLKSNLRVSPGSSSRGGGPLEQERDRPAAAAVAVV